MQLARMPKQSTWSSKYQPLLVSVYLGSTEIFLRLTVFTKLAGSRPQAGSRMGGLANEVFAASARRAIICENYNGSYCENTKLTCGTCNLDIFVAPSACMAFSQKLV